MVLTVSTGGESIVTASAAVMPPPGAGVITETCADPAVAISAAPIVACSVVLVTNVVGRFAPFHRTVEDAMNLLPVTVSVNPATPAMTVAGDNDVITGTGLYVGSTVTIGLVAIRLLSTNKRNSYVPEAAGIETAHVRFVTPAPT